VQQKLPECCHCVMIVVVWVWGDEEQPFVGCCQKVGLKCLPLLGFEVDFVVSTSGDLGYQSHFDTHRELICFG